MRRPFSVWKRWDDRKELRNLKYPGVYVLCISRKPLQGTRFTWLRSIVYVGMTNSRPGLMSRLQQFDDTVAGRRTFHGGADRVRYKNRNYARLASRLFVSVCAVECDVTSEKPRDIRTMGKVAELEYICLARYAQKFGKRPEFNNTKAAPKYSRTVARRKKKR